MPPALTAEGRVVRGVPGMEVGGEICNAVARLRAGMLDVQQIFGRAGRPQFEQEGLGIIITQHAQVNIAPASNPMLFWGAGLLVPNPRHAAPLQPRAPCLAGVCNRRVLGASMAMPGRKRPH